MSNNASPPQRPLHMLAWNGTGDDAKSIPFCGAHDRGLTKMVDWVGCPQCRRLLTLVPAMEVWLRIVLAIADRLATNPDATASRDDLAQLDAAKVLLDRIDEARRTSTATGDAFRPHYINGSDS